MKKVRIQRMKQSKWWTKFWHLRLRNFIQRLYHSLIHQRNFFEHSMHMHIGPEFNP
ncbi:hypothetical protein YC2023_064877 [Brassica napus]